jgi:hypothetical protein
MNKQAERLLADADIELDLHGHHPDDVCGAPLAMIFRTAWEAGAGGVRLIHGHGRNRGISPGFVNTNTGYFGLRIRSELRHNEELRQWVKHSTLDCSHEGSTVVKLKRNPTPTLSTDIEAKNYPDWDSLLPSPSI